MLRASTRVSSSHAIVWLALGLACAPEPDEAGLRSLTVRPSTVTMLSVKAPVQLAATGVGPDGGRDLQPRVAWSSSDPEVATVDATGAVRGVGVGLATIRATADGVSASSTVDVRQLAYAIELTPEHLYLYPPGALAQLTATVRTPGGDVIDPAELTWSTSDRRIAAVDANGLVEVINEAGWATIQVAAGRLTAEASLEIGYDCYRLLWPKLALVDYSFNGGDVPVALTLTNQETMPAQLWREAPDLEPCGTNRRSSRTWVTLLDRSSNWSARYCAMGPDSLEWLYVTVPWNGTDPPRLALSLWDRRCGHVYETNTVTVSPPP